MTGPEGTAEVPAPLDAAAGAGLPPEKIRLRMVNTQSQTPKQRDPRGAKVNKWKACVLKKVQLRTRETDRQTEKRDSPIACPNTQEQ